MITLTITSCKRPELFKRTLESFRKNCLEFGLIDEVVWADDHSSDIDFSRMETTLARVFRHQENVNFKVLHNISGEKGLDKSLNFILDSVSNEYSIHIEDDWEFKNPRKKLFIAESLVLLSEIPYAIQILLKDRPMFDTFWGPYSSLPHRLWEVGVANDGQTVTHYGFTLNPSVIRWKFIKQNYGYFNLANIENTFSEQIYKDGFRTITLCENYIEHIGADNPAFILNNTIR